MKTEKFYRIVISSVNIINEQMVAAWQILIYLNDFSRACINVTIPTLVDNSIPDFFQSV
jgi:hypothetical protein